GRPQVGPGGGEVSRGQGQPAADLSQQRAGGRLRQSRIKLDPGGEGRDIGELGPFNQRIGSAIQRRRNRNATSCSAARSMTVRTSLSAATSSPRRALTAARTQAASASPATEPCDRA